MANTTNFGWETPDDTDLVKDGAAAIRTLGSAIDTSLADLEGGTTGQILAKNSNTDMDFIWVTNDVGDITEVQAGTGISIASGTGPIPVVTNTVATEFDAKGDLVVGTGADTFDKLTVGANDTVLVADSSTATGLKWAVPAGGGSGLTLIKTQTIGSGVSSVTVSDAFSSTYDNYLITINGGVASGGCSLDLQLGSTTTGYYWFGVYGEPNSATVSGVNGDNQTKYRYIGAGDANNLSGQVIIHNPNLAKRTTFHSHGSRTGTNLVLAAVGGSETSTTQHTAFTLLVSSPETVTGGTIRVYGYANS